jgi:signal transduction histidine kinase
MERFFMERLKYIVEDSTIAELLGVQNFTKKESAILELVKNAYDAQAKNVSITFSEHSIVIVDDGIGMSENTIHKNWMHVGRSEKGYSLSHGENNDGRVLAGSKGIGRFALARLGASVVVYSAKKGELPVKWTTDWSESILYDLTNEENLPIGTRIEISALRDRWTEKAIKNLIDYLSITCKDDRMHIKIYPNYGKDVSYIFKTPQLGENFVTQIALFYDASEMKLRYTILSDEFSDIAKNYCPSLDLQNFSNDVPIVDELSGDAEIDFPDGELQAMLENLGDFSAELYFSLKTATKQDVERFCYNYSALQNRYDAGVVLYRNAFSIASFDGEKDWLGLNQRSRKSPAAATHPTGAWRVRSNQISGKVEIDKKENSQLRDLANRQGLEENEYFKLFVRIITIGIAAFERYRQSIIRSIDKKNAPKPSPTTPMIDRILKGPNKAVHLTSSDVKALTEEISALKEESKSFQVEKESTEQKYRYDVRILNVLATTGLKASSIAHELKNDRNSVSVNYQYIVDALKEYGFWEELCSQEYTEYSYKNVPQLLNRNKAINQKIVAFMDTMLDEIEKKKFSPRSLSVSGIVENIKANWVRDYASLSINLDVDETVYFETSEDVFTAIFDNLILNSWQQNKASSQITIDISIRKAGGFLKIVYADFGVGLPPKYINDPMRILEVHESSRENGHGLGMWIVHNTIRMTGGDVISIDGHNGFHFNFELGEKL